MRKSRFSHTETDSVSRSESLGDSNPEVLMAWAFRDASIPVMREAGAETLTTTGIRDFCGAWVTDCRMHVLALAW